jgi:hypothetical protein
MCREARERSCSWATGWLTSVTIWLASRTRCRGRPRWSPASATGGFALRRRGRASAATSTQGCQSWSAGSQPALHGTGLLTADYCCPSDRPRQRPELTTRTEAAYSAQTHGELARITADLPERLSDTASAQRAHSHRMVSVFANVARTGWWRAEGTVSPMSLFGDVEVDLRQAAVPAGEVEINAIAPFGDIDVIVPMGSASS